MGAPSNAGVTLMENLETRPNPECEFSVLPNIYLLTFSLQLYFLVCMGLTVHKQWALSCPVPFSGQDSGRAIGQGT